MRYFHIASEAIDNPMSVQNGADKAGHTFPAPAFTPTGFCRGWLEPAPDAPED
jgi:hypothetical protein